MAGIGEITPETVAGQVFRFSTDDFRKHERPAAWREAFGRALLNIDINPRSKEGFHAEATIFRTARLGVIHASTSAVDQGNSPSLITNDDVTFSWSLSSRWVVSKLGRSVELYPGDGMLSGNDDVGGVAFPDECRYVGFRLPRPALASLVPDLGALLVHRIPAANPVLGMLQRYLDLAHEDHVAADAALQDAFADHLCDLLALALGATRDATEQARTRGLLAARLRAMQDDIQKSCRHPDLTVHTVAVRHGVTPRYVQRIFEASGSTFTQYLAEQRLIAAHKALRRPTSTEVPISTIALDCGFSDVSHFNRLFRQRFGCTPSDVRKTARSGGA